MNRSKWVSVLAFTTDGVKEIGLLLDSGAGRSEHSTGVFPVMVRASEMEVQAISPGKEP